MNEFEIGDVVFTEEDIPVLEMALRSLKKGKDELNNLKVVNSEDKNDIFCK